MPYKDKEEEKENKRLYWEVNKNKINSYHREYYKSHKYVNTRSAYYFNTKEAYASRSKQWYSNEDNKVKKLVKTWKISKAELRLRQNDLCSIGGEKLPSSDSQTHTDHDHSCCPGNSSCGKCVRGLSCRRHNIGLGMFDDDFEALERAAKYVFDWKVRLLNEL